LELEQSLGECGWTVSDHVWSRRWQEGAISNVFIEKEGQWFTPPVACKLLPGIYRRHLLETKPAAAERTLQLEDLASADAVYICNAVRGCREVTVVPVSNS
jgi:para-aminobenzoate synthetase/4-amino-4-deoxychorismate lyase